MRLLSGLARWLLAISVSATLSVMPVASTRLVAAELPTGATLTVLADPVEVASADLTTFVPAVAGQSLAAGDIVRTGDSGMALLTFFDGSESQLSAGSQVQIEQAEYVPAPQIALLQSGGVTINRVIPLPPGGSFRTDTPEATGLVRGTSYIVSVGASSDDTSGDPSATSIALLTDRDGHVGHVQMVLRQDPDPADAMDLVQAGDVGAAAGAACATGHLDADSLASLESSARDLHNVSSGRQAHALARQVLPASAPMVSPVEPDPATPALRSASVVTTTPTEPSRPVTGPTSDTSAKPAAGPSGVGQPSHAAGTAGASQSSSASPASQATTAVAPASTPSPVTAKATPTESGEVPEAPEPRPAAPSTPAPVPPASQAPTRAPGTPVPAAASAPSNPKPAATPAAGGTQNRQGANG